MSPPRVVSGDKAGPNAIGILVPPAPRTFLIVRPRSLCFDLLVLAEAHGSAFREFEREQASRAAEALLDALCSLSSIQSAKTEVRASNSDPEALELRLHVGPFHLLVCERQPGKPYAPLHFINEISAGAAAESLRLLIAPPNGMQQEFYLNTRFFQR
jgi:hypothetical protein